MILIEPESATVKFTKAVFPISCTSSPLSLFLKSVILEIVFLIEGLIDQMSVSPSCLSALHGLVLEIRFVALS
jgi:hypothetical protein